MTGSVQHHILSLNTPVTDELLIGPTEVFGYFMWYR